jgi:hypothetical protein
MSDESYILTEEQEAILMNKSKEELIYYIDELLIMIRLDENIFPSLKGEHGRKQIPYMLNEKEVN